MSNKNSGQKVRHQKMVVRRQRWLAPFCYFCEMVLDFTCVCVWISEYNLMTDPDTGISNVNLVAHMMRLSAKTQEARYSNGQPVKSEKELILQ